MPWIHEIATSTIVRVVTVVVGIGAAAFLWWALADLFLATFSVPDVFERWRHRRRRDGDDESEGAGATA